jgi:hypothetical protein
MWIAQDHGVDLGGDMTDPSDWYGEGPRREHDLEVVGRGDCAYDDDMAAPPGVELLQFGEDLDSGTWWFRVWLAPGADPAEVEAAVREMAAGG